MSNFVQRKTSSNNRVEEAFPKQEIKSITENSSKIGRVKPKNNSYINEKPTWSQNLKDYFSQYCKSSGVHGVRYLGESGRFVIEKLIWAITLIAMCYLCISLILKAFYKWTSSPVIVTFATTETPIWKIPFPAVTICPEIKSDPDVFNYSDIFLKKVSDSYVTPEENEVFESLTLVCAGISILPELITKVMKNSSYTLNASVITNIFDVSPPIIDDGYVVWKGKEQRQDILSESYTTEGLCYSFNVIDPKELLVDPGEYKTIPFKSHTKSKRWSLEEGYPNEDRTDDFPRRTFIAGVVGGLSIDVFTNSSYIDRFCSDANEGFRVTIHHPAEFPNMDGSFTLPLDQIVLVAIKPKMIIVAEELKHYTPEYRKCYFSNERNLTYFRSYSQQNCLSECLTNYTIQQCGCVPFYMPKSKSFLICGPASISCVETSQVNYLLSNSNNTMRDCNCLPSCTSLEYEVEISQSNWAWRESFSALKNLMGDKYSDIASDIEKIHLSRLVVYFKEMQFLALERHEIYGKIEFFSNTGGLLGLFIGFSITSAIEILYFLTVRIICNIRKYGRGFWSGQDN